MHWTHLPPCDMIAVSAPCAGALRDTFTSHFKQRYDSITTCDAAKHPANKRRRPLKEARGPGSERRGRASASSAAVRLTGAIFSLNRST